MLLIISATNRPDSRTEKISKYCFEYLKAQSYSVHFYPLTELPGGVLHNNMFETTDQQKDLTQIQDKLIVPASKIVFVIPEYNGGIPGALKIFIDALSVRKYDESFKDKKACLIGVSTGRAGNLRGLDYFTNVLNYLNMHVFRLKLPISRVDEYMDDDGKLDEETARSIRDLLDEFCEY